MTSRCAMHPRAGDSACSPRDLLRMTCGQLVCRASALAHRIILPNCVSCHTTLQQSMQRDVIDPWMARTAPPLSAPSPPPPLPITVASPPPPPPGLVVDPSHDPDRYARYTKPEWALPARAVLANRVMERDLTLHAQHTQQFLPLPPPPPPTHLPLYYPAPLSQQQQQQQHQHQAPVEIDSAQALRDLLATLGH